MTPLHRLAGEYVSSVQDSKHGQPTLLCNLTGSQLACPTLQLLYLVSNSKAAVRGRRACALHLSAPQEDPPEDDAGT